MWNKILNVLFTIVLLFSLAGGFMFASGALFATLAGKMTVTWGKVNHER